MSRMRQEKGGKDDIENGPIKQWLWRFLFCNVMF